MDKSNWLNRYIVIPITEAVKYLWSFAMAILGILFLLIIVVVWLTYLGIIPRGETTTDRYSNERSDMFR